MTVNSTPVVPTALPTPSATSTPFEEVVLATGRRFDVGAATETELILRNDGSGWAAMGFGVPAGTVLNGIAFSTTDVAWAYGFFQEQEKPVLLRSSDAGVSWTDVAANLPLDCHGIVALAFADAMTGYLVSHRILSPATTFATRDGGTTWRPVAVSSSGIPLGAYALGFRGGTSELLRFESDGLSIVRLDDLTISPLVLAASGESSIAGASSFATAGSRGWIAAAIATTVDFPFDRAGILTSAAPGGQWVDQRVAHTGNGELFAIDIRDPQSGIAGGSQIATPTSGLSALALVMDVDGASWREAPIAGLPAGWEILDVTRMCGEGAWAVAIDITSDAVEAAFLESDDGGRSWRHAETMFEHDVHLVDLARNTSAR
jgi:hypothetical protein